MPFFTLYGHLSERSLEGLEAGREVGRGERVGWVGSLAVNGGWPPHLHFQVIVDLLGRAGDFPGVAAPSEREVWLSLVPGSERDPRDPRERLPGEAGRTVTRSWRAAASTSAAT